MGGNSLLIRETRDEDGHGAFGVELGVHSALRKHRHSELRQLVADEARAVLEDGLGVQAAFDDEIELGGARMHVRRVEAAGAEEAHRHGAALAHESGEGVLVGAGDVAAFAFGDAECEGRVVELEDVLVVGEEFGALDCAGSEDELLE